MGSWGVGPFDNDDAAELLGTLLEAETTSIFLTTLNSALDLSGMDEYDEDQECQAVAAAAVVELFARDQPGPLVDNRAEDINPVRPTQAHAAQLLERFQGAEVVALIRPSIVALEIVTSPDSNIFELRDGDPDWLDGLEKLKAALLLRV